jgi:hypothetical protein
MFSFRGGMGVIERQGVSWEDASFAVFAVLAWLSASLVSLPQVSLKSSSKAGVEIAAAAPSSEPIMASIEDDEIESQEDDLEACWPADVRLLSPSSGTLSQIMPPQGVCLSVLTPAQCPLLC